MELSKDTWHYRNFEIWRSRSRSSRHRDLRRGKREPDLCTYTRIVLFYAWPRRLGRFFDHNEWFQAVVFSIFLYLVGLAIGFAFWELLKETGLPLWVLFVSPIVVMPTFIGIVFGLIFSKERYDRWSHRRKYGEPQEQEPNVLVEYIKAKKRKICPVIEFKDV